MLYYLFKGYGLGFLQYFLPKGYLLKISAKLHKQMRNFYFVFVNKKLIFD